MFDIEKELSKLKMQQVPPDEALRQRTRRKVKEAHVRKGTAKLRIRPAAIMSSLAAAIAVILVFLVFAQPAQAASGYYTIDINPSINVAVDENDIVIAVTARNGDASELLSGLNLTGMKFEDALKAIVEAARGSQYLGEGSHLLVAHFGEGGITQEQLDAIVAEQAPGTAALLISSSKSDYDGGRSGESAGVKLLFSNAKKQGIDSENLDSVIHTMREDKDKADNDVNNGNGGGNGNDKDNSGGQNPGQGNIDGKDNQSDKDKPEASSGGKNEGKSEKDDNAKVNNSDNGVHDKEKTYDEQDD